MSFRTTAITGIIFALLLSACGSDSEELAYSQSGATIEQAQFLVLVNDFRRKSRSCGGVTYPAARALRVSAALTEAARLHSAEMAASGELDHEGSDGSRFDSRARRAGYAGCPRGENIAYHTAVEADVARVFDQWRNSAAHCRNLMTASADELGFAFAAGKAPGSTRTAQYYTMILGSSGCR